VLECRGFFRGFSGEGVDDADACPRNLHRRVRIKGGRREEKVIASAAGAGRVTVVL